MSTPLAIAYCGTGSVNADAAIANLGGVKKSGDTMTGNLNIQGTLYPSLCLLPTNSGQTNVPAEAPPAEGPQAEAPAEIRLEQIRAVLADKSRAGHTAAVRELLKKYGATKLSQVDPKHYAAILKETEGWTDAT